MSWCGPRSWPPPSWSPEHQPVRHLAEPDAGQRQVALLPVEPEMEEDAAVERGPHEAQYVIAVPAGDDDVLDRRLAAWTSRRRRWARRRGARPSSGPARRPPRRSPRGPRSASPRRCRGRDRWSSRPRRHPAHRAAAWLPAGTRRFRAHRTPPVRDVRPCARRYATYGAQVRVLAFSSGTCVERLKSANQPDNRGSRGHRRARRKPLRMALPERSQSSLQAPAAALSDLRRHPRP